MPRLVDSSVVIDVLRGEPAAISYFEKLRARPCLSVITVAEIRAGERGDKERGVIDMVFANATLLPVDRSIAEAAGALMKRFSKSHRLDTADAVIAATAQHHGLELVTLNLKHFPMFPGLPRPY